MACSGKEYAGKTLRENLGVPIAPVAAWRRTRSPPANRMTRLADRCREPTCNSTGGHDASPEERKSRSENVLGLQKSVRVPGVRSRHDARAAVRRTGTMDSVPAASEGQGGAQRLFRVQGQILLHGCSALGESARSLDPRPVESL